MALAQPTGLKVQALEPLITVEQDVWRYVTGDCKLLTESGDALITESGDTLETQPCLIPLLTALQLVDDSAVIRPTQALVTLDQTIITEIDQPRQALITLHQIVTRQALTQRLIRVRQITLVAS